MFRYLPSEEVRERIVLSPRGQQFSRENSRCREPKVEKSSLCFWDGMAAVRSASNGHVGDEVRK